MPNTRSNPDPVDQRLDNPDQLLRRIRVPSGSTRPPLLYSNLAQCLNLRTPQPGEKILAASKTIAELFHLNPVPLSNLSPGSSTILTNILEANSDNPGQRRKSFVPGSLPDTTGISANTTILAKTELPTPNPTPNMSDSGEATNPESVAYESSAQAEMLQDELRRIREESADGLARVVAEKDDLRTELRGLKSLLTELVTQSWSTSRRAEEGRPGVTTSTLANAARGTVPLPRPESSLEPRAEGEGSTPSIVEQPSFSRTNPFAPFCSPRPVQEPETVHHPPPMPAMPTYPPDAYAYWHRFTAPGDREVLAQNLKDSEIPKFTCAYGDVAGFRLWRYRIEARFKVKGLDSDAEKLKVLAAALAVPHAVQWHRTHEGELERRTWEEAMEMLM